MRYISSRYGDILKRVISFISIAFIIVLFLSACSNVFYSKEERAKTLLEKKYKKAFEISEVYSQKLGAGYYEVQAYDVEKPELRFTAAIDANDSNISDTYAERCVCADISSKIMKNLGSLQESCYIVTHAMGPQPSTDDSQISIQEYASLFPNNGFRVRTELFVTYNQTIDRIVLYQSLEEMLSGLEDIRFNVDLYIVDELQSKDVQEYWKLNENPNSMEYGEMLMEYPLIELEFNQGKLEMSQEQFLDKIGDLIDN